MRERSYQALIGTISWLLWLLPWALVAQQATSDFAWPPQDAVGRVVLASAAFFCLRWTRRGVPSIASASLVALLALRPDVWSLALGLLALSAGPRARVHAVSAASVGYALAYLFLTSALAADVVPAELAQAIRVAIAWGLYEGGRRAIGLPLEALGLEPARRFDTVEWLNPVLAWLLAVLAPAGQVAALIAWLTVPGQALLVRLYHARSELVRVREALDSRKAELLTLHAVGRELLTRASDERLGPLLDRECRKLFDPDGFLLVLVTDAGWRAVYRREGERIDTVPVAVDEAIERRLAEDKNGHCWYRSEGPPPYATGLRRARSGLLVPLMVEDRIAGAVAIESRRPERYDEHHLAVLTTLAQQAAAALESAHRQRRATIDSLTAFYLRDYFFRRLDEEQRRARRYGGRFALMMIDLDGFKAVNDRHGHLVGDRYLRAVSRRIRDQLRAADMPCRYGGDEFAVLLPETDLQGACAIGERIRRAVSTLELDAEGVLLRGTVSIGLAGFPEHARGDDSKALMRHADEALYRAKRGGRDRVVPYAA